MKPPLSRPCGQCPWRRDSAPGWLGAATPEQFLATALSEEPMPCHMAVDYEQDDWQDRLDEVPLCAGLATFLRNRCHMPRDPVYARQTRMVAPDWAAVFVHAEQFLNHHRREANGE